MRFEVLGRHAHIDVVHDMAVAVEDKLIEVPVDFAALLNWVVRSQVSVDGVGILSVDSYFFEDWELGALATLGKSLDLF